MKLRLYTWLEFLIWFIIISIFVVGFRIYKYEQAKRMPSYQIFMPDVDGMIVGSPVRYMGVQVGYVKNIKLLSNDAYVRFIITKKDLKLPKGVIATVEFNGLGGSKSLELYPPTEKTEHLILIKRPTRLSDAIGLLADMFEKIDSITLRSTYFAGKMGVITSSGKMIDFNPENIGTNLRHTNNFADVLIQNRKEFRTRLDRINNFEKENQNIKDLLKPTK